MMPVLMPAPRVTKVLHDAVSASGAGGNREHNADAVAVFSIGGASEEWSGVVLAVADGLGCSARGDLASGLAVDGFENCLTSLAHDLELTSQDWQEPVAMALAAAFEHANEKVRTLLDTPGEEPGHGVALTAAALLGDWLCVAHAGDCRVYRLSKNSLEQMTADHHRLAAGRNHATEQPVRALGLAAHVTPAIAFFRLNAGDVVLACSNGLCRRLNGGDLTRLMSARRPVSEIAHGLVTMAARRGGEDDMSACLARVRRLPGKRLPEPAGHVALAPVAAPLTLLRRPVRKPSSRPSRRFGLMLGVLALAGGLIGGWSRWRASGLAAAPELAVAPVLPPQSPDATPPPAPVLETTPAAPVAPQPAPRADPAVAPPTRLTPSDSVERHQRQLALLRERQVRDSQAAARTKAEQDRLRDSMLAAQVAAAAEQKERVRREAQVLADQEAAARAAASAAATAATAAAERAHDQKLAAGKTALAGWMNDVVSTVNSGNPGATVLAAGPSGFAAFVAKNQPTLSDARLLTATVNEQTGEATAEWVAKWRTAFGTAMSRRMKATATVVPDGATWRLRDWRITEGAP